MNNIPFLFYPVNESSYLPLSLLGNNNLSPKNFVIGKMSKNLIFLTNIYYYILSLINNYFEYFYYYLQIHHSFPEIDYMLLFILGNSIQGMSYRNMMKPKNYYCGILYENSDLHYSDIKLFFSGRGLNRCSH